MRKMVPALIALAATTAFSVWAYFRLPARVVTHWNMSGQPDGWSSPLLAAALIPAIMALLVPVFLALPRIDPLRKNYELHASTYWAIVNTLLLFMAGVQALTIGANLGWRVRIEQWVPFAVGALFVVIGNLMSRMRPNWFMGIRTPWTLSSEKVWRKTHRLGGYLFVLAGLMIATLGVIRARWVMVTLIIAVAIVALVPIVYSYLLWRREQTEGA